MNTAKSKTSKTTKVPDLNMKRESITFLSYAVHRQRIMKNRNMMCCLEEPTWNAQIYVV
jgi:hypothetical protein